MPMLALDAPSTAKLRDRWLDTKDQRASTYQAIRRGDLSVANTPAEVKARATRIKKAAAPEDKKKLTLEGIVNQDDSLPLSFLSTGLSCARAVARIVQRLADPDPLGTGFLVTPRLLLTNNHVCRTEADASERGAQFNYVYDSTRGAVIPDLRRLEPEVFFYTNIELDFTLVAVARSLSKRNPGDQYGFIRMIEAGGKAIRGNALNLIHHPAGNSTNVAIRSNLMVAEDENWIQYQGDTRKGSSGAPVFNDQWELVALHHGGYEDDSAGDPVTASGAPWKHGMDEDLIAYVHNEGARISRIVAHIRNADFKPSQRRLVASI